MSHHVRPFALLGCCLLFVPSVDAGYTADASAGPDGTARSVAVSSVFPKAKVRFARDKDRLLVDEDADLVLDDSARRLVVRNGHHPLNIGYDDVRKVVIELNTHPRKPGFGASFLGMLGGGLLFGGAIATSIDKPLDLDHFVYLEYAMAGGGTASYLLSLDKGCVPRALKVIKAAFGDRVLVATFDERLEHIEKDQTKAPFPLFKAKATALIHPLPELRPDKALVVVSCPATFFRQNKAEKSGFGVSIQANDTVVGFNFPGTYTFFYLTPGDYFIASRAWHTDGLHLNVEAGKDYYLVQALYAGGGFRPKSCLIRHSRELVMYEVAGSLWSEWSLLPPKGEGKVK